MTVRELQERLINIHPDTPILINDNGVRAHIFVSVSYLAEPFNEVFKPSYPIDTTVVEIFSD